MSVRSPDARLAAAIPLAQLLDAGFAVTQPEVPLPQAAGEDGVGGLLDLFAQRGIRGFFDAGCSIGISRDRDENVLPCPFHAMCIDEIVERDLELGAAMPKRIVVVGLGRIGAAAEADEIGGRAGEFVVERAKDELGEEPVELGDVVRIVGACQEMDIDEIAFHRSGVQAQLDVREQEIAVG